MLLEGPGPPASPRHLRKVHFNGTTILSSEMRVFLYFLPKEVAAVSGSGVRGAAPSKEGWAG